MASSAPPASFTYRAVGIIAHPTKQRVLVLSAPNASSLPQVTWQEPEWTYWTDVTRLLHELRQRLGLELFTARCLSDRYDAVDTSFSRVYAMELTTTVSPLPERARWMEADDLLSLRLLDGSYQSRLEQWLADRSADAHDALSDSWYHPGWFGQVTTWIEEQATWLGAQLEAPPEQLRVGERGRLLRARTSAGVFYVKALPPFSAHEISILRYLANSYPDEVPALVATDMGARWMLMRDFGDRLLSQSDDLNQWEEALRRYANLQVDQARQGEQLTALGCPQISLELLSAHVETLLEDKEALQVDSPIGLTADELLRLRHALPLIQSLCRQLAQSPVPLSLEHGDFYAQNIAVSGAIALYFDWTDCCITHPFFSLYPFMLGIEERWASIPDIRSRFRDVYLQPWKYYAAHEQLVADFELAQQLAPLYLASLYHLLILPNMQAKWEMQHGVPFNLKTLLARLHGDGTAH